MRLLIVGTLKGQLTTATKIAMDNGASVTHAEAIEQAMAVLRGGKGADLLLVDVSLDIRDLVMRLEAEHIHVPIVACGISNDARAAVAAIHAGAKEYIPLPPDPELRADLTAPTWTLSGRGITLESKDDLRRRLGRSPGKGDACCMALSEGDKAVKRSLIGAVMPRVNVGYRGIKRRH